MGSLRQQLDLALGSNAEKKLAEISASPVGRRIKYCIPTLSGNFPFGMSHAEIRQ